MTKEELVKIINGNDVKSRRQLYTVLGRSKQLRQALDEYGLLKPTRWTRERIISRIRDIYEHTGEIPKASEHEALSSAARKRYFFSWNDALFEALGEVRQHRYGDLDWKKYLTEYVRKYQKIPYRYEFNGKDYPEWSALLSRSGCKNWSEMIGHLDLSGITFYATKFGFGTLIPYEGILYLSKDEYLIGKYLTDNSIEFEKEVPYGNCDSVFDFYLPQYDTYIECYGIATKEYLDRIVEKKSNYNSRNVVEIYKHENTVGKLAKEVQRLQSSIAQ